MSKSATHPDCLGILLFGAAARHQAEVLETFEQRGHRVEVHTEATAAWNAWRSGVFAMFIVTDPAGWGLCRQVTSQRRSGSCQVLAFLDESQEEELEAALESGADDVTILPMEQCYLELRVRLAEQRLRAAGEWRFFGGATGMLGEGEEVQARILAQLKLETALRRAVDQWQFEVLYQPIVELKGGRVVGLEALVRWMHPERGVVLPNEFINLAEKTGLITTLGSRVLAEACLQMKEWQDQLLKTEEAFVSVNLSPRQLAQPNLAEEVQRVLKESGLAPGSLVLELTETAMLEQDEHLLKVLGSLKDLGVRLSLDDFGTGPCSLSMLYRLPFDLVKIDRAFVGNVGVDAASDELVEGVLELCRWQSLATVAEGVESVEQRQRLRELGCSYAQGYLFAEPGGAEVVGEFLQRHL